VNLEIQDTNQGLRV